MTQEDKTFWKIFIYIKNIFVKIKYIKKNIIFEVWYLEKNVHLKKKKNLIKVNLNHNILKWLNNLVQTILVEHLLKYYLLETLVVIMQLNIKYNA